MFTFVLFLLFVITVLVAVLVAIVVVNRKEAARRAELVGLVKMLQVEVDAMKSDDIPVACDKVEVSEAVEVCEKKVERHEVVTDFGSQPLADTFAEFEFDVDVVAVKTEKKDAKKVESKKRDVKVVTDVVVTKDEKVEKKAGKKVEKKAGKKNEVKKADEVKSETEKKADEVKSETEKKAAAKHKVGDKHPNGKWTWIQYAEGKYGWRSDASKHIGDEKVETATEKKEEAKTEKKDEVKKVEVESETEKKAGKKNEVKATEKKKETKKAAAKKVEKKADKKVETAPEFETAGMLSKEDLIAMTMKAFKTEKLDIAAQHVTVQFGCNFTTIEKVSKKDGVLMYHYLSTQKDRMLETSASNSFIERDLVAKVYEAVTEELLAQWKKEHAA